MHTRRGLFGTCRSQTDSGKEACCRRMCLPVVKRCEQLCETVRGNAHHGVMRCRDRCQLMRSSCVDTCRLAVPYRGGRCPLIEAARRQGCGDGTVEPIRPECLKRHRVAVLQSFRRLCRPASYRNCTAHCQSQYDWYSY